MYSFLCKGKNGYWIYEDIEYLVDGKKNFTELTDEQRDYLAIAIVPSGGTARLIINALNTYFQYHRIDAENTKMNG